MSPSLRFLRGVFLSALAVLPLSAAAQTGEIRGQVVTAAGGMPLMGLNVQVEYRYGPWAGSTTTAPDGTYAVGSLPDGTYIVRVNPALGYAGQLYDRANEFDYDLAKPVVISGGAAVPNVDFALETAGSISGTISGLLPGQSVNVQADDASSGRFRGSVNSDAAFAYTIPSLPAGIYRLRVNPGGTDRAAQYWDNKLSRSTADDIVVGPGETAVGKNFALTQGGTITGTLTLTPPGDPQAFWVNAMDPATGEWFSSTQPASDGTYALTNLPAGSWAVQVNTGQSGYIQEFYSSSAQDVAEIAGATALTVAAGGTLSGIHLTLELGRQLTGHVYLDSDQDNTQDAGEPDVADAQVNVNHEGPCCSSAGGTRTDAAGNYVISGLRPGRYSVEVTATSPDTPFVQEWWNNKSHFGNNYDYVDASLSDASGIDFGVDPGVVISGLVFRDLNGNGARDAGEPVVAGNGQARARLDSTGLCCVHAFIGSDGRYALAVPPGTYRVDASAWQGNLLREYWDNQFFFEEASAVTPPASGIDFSMDDASQYGTLRGRVIAEGGGEGAAGVEVEVFRFDTGDHLQTVNAAADGSFRISGLPPASYRVLFYTQNSNLRFDKDLVGEYWTRCQTQACTPGVIDPNDQKIVFPAAPAPGDGPGADLGTFALVVGGSIEGTVRTRDGGPLPLPMDIRTQSYVSSGGSLPAASVGTDGGYRVRGVPAPSTYKIRAVPTTGNYVPSYYQTAVQSTFDWALAGPVSVSVGLSTPGIDVFLEAGGSISGTVTCSNGTLVAGNYPITIDRSDNRLPGVRAYTNAGGDYLARGLPAGQYNVRADARGESYGDCGVLANERYPSLVTVAAGLDTPDIDFDLESGALVSGRVTQSDGGQPVVNLRVSASEWGTGQFVSDAHTDADGRYSIASLRSGGEYRLRVETRDDNTDVQFFNFIQEYYGNTVQQSLAAKVVAPASSKDFQLDLGGAISGMVADEGTGQAIFGVNICADIYVSGGFDNCDFTDQNGFYVIRGLPATTYRVSANPSPLDYAFEFYDGVIMYNSATPVPVAGVPPGDPIPITGGINFSLGPGRRIEGRAFHDQDADGFQDPGEPAVAGVCVNASDPSGNNSGDHCTDAEGNYTIAGLAPTRYTVSIYPYSAGPYAGEYYRRDPVTGHPIGTFEGPLADSVDLTAGSAVGIDFSLSLGGTVRGSVRDAATGLPIPDVEVTVSQPSTGWGLSGENTDTEGRYSVSGIPAGSFYVRARDNAGTYVPEYHLNALFQSQATAVAVSPRGSVSDTTTATEVDFELVNGGAVEGIVYEDQNGNGAYDAGEPPVVGANVQVSVIDGSSSSCCLGSGNTQTGADGSFRVGGLPPARTLRVFLSPGSASDLVGVYYVAENERGSISSTSATTFTLAAGATRTSVNFGLVQGGSIEGDLYHDLDADGVRDTGEPGLAGVNVNVSTPSFCCYGQNRNSDATGHYRVRGVPNGSYRVQANPASSTDYVAAYYDGGTDQGNLNSSSAALVPVTAGSTRAGVDFGLNLGGVIEGIVYHDQNDNGQRDAGEPGLAGLSVNASVTLSSTSNICCFGNGNRSTDANGVYRLRGVPAAVGGVPTDIRLQASTPASSPTDYLSVYWDGGDDRGSLSRTTSVPVYLEGGEVRPGYDFGLGLGGAITGFLRDGNGSPIASFCCINAQPVDTSVNGRGSPATDASGQYAIGALVPGYYRVNSGTPSGFTLEYWDDKPDFGSADLVKVDGPAACGASAPSGCATSGVDFYLTKRPQLASGLTQTSGTQGTTITGVQVGAASLAGPACGTPPCSRVEVAGGGVTVANLSLNGGVFTFDLVIAPSAPLGARTLSIVNDYTIEDSALAIPSAFEVRAPEGAPPYDSPERLYASDQELGQLRIYGTSDNALLGRVDVCCDPGGITLSSEGRLAFVAGTGDRSIAVVDLEIGREVFRATSFGPSGLSALATTPRYVYVVNREAPLNNRVQVFDAITWSPSGHIPVGVNPSGLHLDSSGTRLWVPNQLSAVSIIDVNAASPTLNTVIATIPFPTTFRPNAVAFSPDLDGPGPLGPGARVYVAGTGTGTPSPAGVYVLDGALVFGPDPSAAFIDVDGDPASGWAAGSRTGISPVLTGGASLIDVAPIPESSTVAAYVPSGQQVRVIDLSTNPDRPRIVRSISVNGFGITNLRTSSDGTRLFLGQNASKELLVLETAGLLSGPTIRVTRFDKDGGPTKPLLTSGLARGPRPPAPTSRPVVSSASPDGGSPALNGAAFTASVDGSGFEVDVARNLPIVWLQGTLIRGTVLAGSTPAQLRVGFPAHTPSGDHVVVVTNGRSEGNVSSSTTATLAVRPPASYTPTQNVYVSSFGTDKLLVYEPGAATPAEIQLEPSPSGMTLTPDARSALVGQQYYNVYQNPADFWPTSEGNLAVVDLDPASARFRTVAAQLPYVWSGFESLAATPSLSDPDGVFVYAPNLSLSDTISVVDPAVCLSGPATCREVDVNPAPGTQTYPDNDPAYFGDLGARLPTGLNRVELDSNIADSSKRPSTGALSPDGGTLYVANNTAGAGVSIVRTSDGRALGQYTFDGNRADGNIRYVANVAVSPDGSRVYANGIDSVLDANAFGAPFVYVYDTAVTDDSTGSLVGCFRLPTDPLPGDTAAMKEIGRGLTLTPDGTTAYLVARLRGELWVLDLTQQSLSCPAVAARIPLPAAGALQHDIAGNLLYIANNFTSEVYVYDISSRLSPALVTTLHARCAGDVAVQASFGGPELAGVFPTSGPGSGGTPMTLTGANFTVGGSMQCSDGRTAPVCVEFNGAVADAIVVDNAFTIRATTPPGTDGPASVRVTNPDGRFSELSGRFRYQSDLTAPAFNTPAYAANQTLVGVCPACTVSVEVRWTTDEASDSRIEYGTTAALGTTTSDPTLTTSHVSWLTGLATSTQYHLRASSRDSAGNSGSSPTAPATVAFTTLAAPDTTAPVLTSGPAVSVTQTTALVRWTTNEDATSEVSFDATLDGSPTILVTGSSGMEHAVSLGGLTPDTRYEYRVGSLDPSGNAFSSSVGQLRTSPVPDTTPPVVLAGPSVSYLSNNLVILYWTTNEPSTSFVNYGVYNVHEQGVIDVTLTTSHVVFLTKLLPGTAYGFQFGSADASGNTFVSADPFAAPAAAFGTQQVQQSLRVGVATLEAGTAVTLAAATVGFTTPEAADTTPPVLTAPVHVSVLGSDRVRVTAATDEAASIRVHFGVASLSSSAFDPAFTQTPALLLAGLEAGTRYLVEVVLTDPKGNPRTVGGLSFTTLTAPDTEPPLISGLGSVGVGTTSATIVWTTDEPASASVRYGVSGASLDHTVSGLSFGTTHSVSLVNLQPGMGYTYEVGSADASGNPSLPATGTFTTAYAPPAITSLTPSRLAQGNVTTVTIAGAGFASDALVDAGADVSVGGLSVNSLGTQILASLTVAPPATTGPRILTVTNPNTGPLTALSATTTFTVLDSAAPVVTIAEPANGASLSFPVVTVRGSVSESAFVTVNGVVATVDSELLTYSATITLTTAGLQRISVVGTDSSGNRGSAFVEVDLAVVDTTPPTITVLGANPFNLELGSAFVDPGATAYDAYSGDLTTAITTISTVNPDAVGTYSVVYRVSDPAGNAASASRSVVVVDTTPPAIASVAATPHVLWPPNGQLVPVVVTVTASDSSGASNCHITDVTSDELTQGRGDRGRQPDWVITGPLTLRLRAERSGHGDGRTYTITVLCSDASGNATGGAGSVVVPHDLGHGPGGHAHHDRDGCEGQGRDQHGRDGREESR